MLLETLIQVYFSVADKALKRSYRLAHAIIFMIPLTVFTIFLGSKDAYNYEFG